MNWVMRMVALASIAVAVVSAQPVRAQSGGGGDPFEVFATSDEESGLKPDYGPMNQFFKALGEVRDGRFMLTYSLIDSGALLVLKQYAAYLENIPVSRLSRDVQLAYWLNYRNWMVIQAIAELDRRRRMKGHRGTPLEPGGMWTEKRARVEGVLVSIDDIEQRILLAHWDDPNVLYGLYQGTKGGPALPLNAFVGDSVSQDLARLGHSFATSREGLRLRGSTARVSELYGWYKEALFEGDDGRLIAHLKSLSPARIQDDFAEVKKVRIQDFDYKVDELLVQSQGVPGLRPGR